ncbi:MAG TPA: hypothetical protein VGL53_13270 [Bryobacteraceae bacterium]|jgi:hypothetical protein
MITRLTGLALIFAAAAWTQPKGPGNTYPTPPPMNTSRAPADPLAAAPTSANPKTQLILSGTILLEDGTPPPRTRPRRILLRQLETRRDPHRQQRIF